MSNEWWVGEARIRELPIYFAAIIGNIVQICVVFFLCACFGFANANTICHYNECNLVASTRKQLKTNWCLCGFWVCAQNNVQHNKKKVWSLVGCGRGSNGLKHRRKTHNLVCWSFELFLIWNCQDKVLQLNVNVALGICCCILASLFIVQCISCSLYMILHGFIHLNQCPNKNRKIVHKYYFFWFSSKGLLK